MGKKTRKSNGNCLLSEMRKVWIFMNSVTDRSIPSSHIGERVTEDVGSMINSAIAHFVTYSELPGLAEQPYLDTTEKCRISEHSPYLLL